MPEPASDIKSLILQSSRRRFLQFGFSKVTMDEIAAELRISKKTLYRNFPGKQDILQEIMDSWMMQISEKISAVVSDKTLLYTEKLSKILTFFVTEVSPIFSSPLMMDIQKKVPSMWRKFETFRKKQIHTKFANLVAEGVRTGFLRDDIPEELVVLIYFSVVQSVISPKTLAQLPVTANDAFQFVFSMLFEGLLTDKARKKLRSSQ